MNRWHKEKAPRRQKADLISAPVKSVRDYTVRAALFGDTVVVTVVLGRSTRRWEYAFQRDQWPTREPGLAYDRQQFMDLVMGVDGVPTDEWCLMCRLSESAVVASRSILDVEGTK